MGNKVNSREDMKFKQKRVVQLIVDISMRDKHMDAQERELYDLAHDVQADIDFDLSKASAIAYLDKLERDESVTYYGNTLMRPLGMKVISLDVEREAREKVVSFPKRDYGA